MDQRLSLITLGVADLARARAFYEGVLGWTRVSENEGVAFYNVGGPILALFEHEALANDMGVTGSAPVGPYGGFSLALNLGSRAEVDALVAELEGKGVRIVKRPHEVFWGGYSGYFADVDGHAWEVAYNPFWQLDETGRPVPPGGASTAGDDEADGPLSALLADGWLVKGFSSSLGAEGMLTHSFHLQRNAANKVVNVRKKMLGEGLVTDEMDI